MRQRKGKLTGLNADCHASLQAEITAFSGGVEKTRQKTEASRALSVLIESEPKLQILVLTRFLHANRYPLRSKTL
jgi:hypothetical protein